MHLSSHNWLHSIIETNILAYILPWANWKPSSTRVAYTSGLITHKPFYYYRIDSRWGASIEFKGLLQMKKMRLDSSVPLATYSTYSESAILVNLTLDS